MAKFEVQGVYHVEELPVDAVGDSADDRVVDRMRTKIYQNIFIFEESSLDIEEELGLDGSQGLICSGDVKPTTYDAVRISLHPTDLGDDQTAVGRDVTIVDPD